MKNKELVLQWAKDREIFNKSNPTKQALKTLEEVTELLQAIQDKNPEEVKDAYGDILVTIIIGAELSGLDIEDCLDSAYRVISKRKGSMINGTFVKES